MVLRKSYLDKIIPFIDQDLIKVLVGIRRCGKTVLLGQIKDVLLQRNIPAQNIIQANFESMRFRNTRTAETLYDYIADGDIKTVPIPSFNVLNGGNNAGIKQAFNEFIVMPYRASDIEQAVEIAVKVFNRLGKVIREYTGSEPRVGGSFGWCAPSEDPEVCLNLIQKAIDDCGYTEQCAFALDCAMSEMYDRESKTYYLNGKQVTTCLLYTSPSPRD